MSWASGAPGRTQRHPHCLGLCGWIGITSPTYDLGSTCHNRPSRQASALLLRWHSAAYEDAVATAELMRPAEQRTLPLPWRRRRRFVQRRRAAALAVARQHVRGQARPRARVPWHRHVELHRGAARRRAACERNMFWRISAPFASCRSPQAALNFSYRIDRVTRD